MVELLRLQEVFIRMKEAGLNKVEPHKYCLFPQHVSYLGHLVSDGGISTDPVKIHAVKDGIYATFETSCT